MLTLAILGKTGSGKTSLSNVLFELDWLTDGAVACTQGVQQHEGSLKLSLNNEDFPRVRLLDTPGVGESEIADEEHFHCLYKAFHKADIILWVIQADSRVFIEDQKAILRLTAHGKIQPQSKIVIALNQIDKVYPENWDDLYNQPSSEQQNIIKEKIALVDKRLSNYLGISEKDIIPCSANKKYGLNSLAKALFSPTTKPSILQRLKQWVKTMINYLKIYFNYTE